MLSHAEMEIPAEVYHNVLGIYMLVNCVSKQHFQDRFSMLASILKSSLAQAKKNNFYPI